MTWLACVVGLAVVLTGCQRLHQEKTWDMKPGDSIYVEVVDAPRNDQKVDVQVAATEAVDVYVVKEEQLREFDKKQGEFDRSKALKVGKGIKAETIQATVPAGTKFGVVVISPKTSNVKVTIDGR
jgi:hypothetical protein